MRHKIFLILISLIVLNSCSKDFLEKTPDKALAVPNQLKDLWALLDHDDMFKSIPSISELGTDDYTLSYTDWNSKRTVWRNSYIWSEDIYEGESASDWNKPYSQIYICNVVLEKIEEFKKEGISLNEYNAIKGTALFYRAFYLFCLQEIYGEPYNLSNSENALGIPLRLSSNVETSIKRASVKQTFDQIVKDLNLATTLLPREIYNLNLRYRPFNNSAKALLSRVYLVMQEYPNALNLANQCLANYPAILDYNQFDVDASIPFPFPANEEVLLLGYPINHGLLSSSMTMINEDLYRLYDDSDLRKRLFFRLNPTLGTFYYKGYYTGTGLGFSGIANDELYLIRAECNIRMGNIVEAQNDLNFLLEHRWVKDTYTPYEFSDGTEGLRIILRERRKELIYRGLRWSDLRRLNQDEKSSVTLYRSLNDSVYKILPNDPRYTYPIPVDEIEISGIEQNNRTSN